MESKVYNYIWLNVMASNGCIYLPIVLFLLAKSVLGSSRFEEGEPMDKSCAEQCSSLPYFQRIVCAHQCSTGASKTMVEKEIECPEVSLSALLKVRNIGVDTAYSSIFTLVRYIYENPGFLRCTLSCMMEGDNNCGLSQCFLDCSTGLPVPQITLSPPEGTETYVKPTIGPIAYSPGTIPPGPEESCKANCAGVYGCVTKTRKEKREDIQRLPEECWRCIFPHCAPRLRMGNSCFYNEIVGQCRAKCDDVIQQACSYCFEC